MEGHEKDFLTVGSMGYASSIAMGIAMFRSKRQVIINKKKKKKIFKITSFKI
jgi:hypothetical protein